MSSTGIELNKRAAKLCADIVAQSDVLRIARETLDCGTTLLDFGVDVVGSVEAGEMLARVCMADAAEILLRDPDPVLGEWPLIEVTTRQPLLACMASQYAGWEVKHAGYFAMGSGPMRAAAAREPLFDELGLRESANTCVGVLESSQLPPDEVCVDIAKKCHIEPADLTLLVAPTASMAGTLQVVARSIETAMHKLHELGFDLSRVVAGQGSAPLPQLAKDDLTAIGVTNDAILYGGRVTLEVTGDDASLSELGTQVPSSASKDYGKPFGEVLASYNHDFYQVDPLLFSAAEVTFRNIETGSEQTFGAVNAEVLRRSFGDS
ncbi:MAG: methenyltetrahydromethanopterin cyclohydrolase [Planctomycetota bacterium]